MTSLQWPRGNTSPTEKPTPSPGPNSAPLPNPLMTAPTLILFAPPPLPYPGEYPLSFAVSVGSKEIVRYLVANGAQVNKDRDTQGNYALHMVLGPSLPLRSRVDSLLKVSSAWRPLSVTGPRPSSDRLWPPFFAPRPLKRHPCTRSVCSH